MVLTFNVPALTHSHPKPHPRKMHAHRTHACIFPKDRNAIARHESHDAGDRGLTAVEIGRYGDLLPWLETLRIARVVSLRRGRLRSARDLDCLAGSHLARAAVADRFHALLPRFQRREFR